jgi:hypothetical protein
VVGLILGIVGGTSGNHSPNGTVQVQTTSKVGIILYLVGFAAMVIILFVSAPQTGAVPPKERRVPVAVAFAMPFILVRLLYSVLSVFVHNHIFNVFNGSVPAWVVMSVLEEFVVVVTYLILGLLVEKLDKSEHGALQGRGWMERRRKRGVKFPLSQPLMPMPQITPYTPTAHQQQETGYTQV